MLAPPHSSVLECKALKWKAHSNTAVIKNVCFLSSWTAAHSTYIAEVLGNSHGGPFWWLSHKFLNMEAFHSFPFPLRILHKKISLLRGAIYFRTIISQVRNPHTLNLEVSPNPIKRVWRLNQARAKGEKLEQKLYRVVCVCVLFACVCMCVHMCLWQWNGDSF